MEVYLFSLASLQNEHMQQKAMKHLPESDRIKKGELTVEQGKVLNQELKHNIKESVKKNVNVTLKPSNPDELKEVLGKMTPDQLAALKEQISKMQAKDVDAEETAEEEEEAEEVEEAKEEYEDDPQE